MSIGVGILGFAHGHVNAYCTQWTQNPAYDIQVTAGWDHDAARLAANSQSFGFTNCASVDELLSRPDGQAVVIASETSLHADLVEKAAVAAAYHEDFAQLPALDDLFDLDILRIGAHLPGQGKGHSRTLHGGHDTVSLRQVEGKRLLHGDHFTSRGSFFYQVGVQGCLRGDHDRLHIRAREQFFN